MTNDNMALLLEQASRLYTLGITVERKRIEIKRFIDKGMPYDDPKVLEALDHFTQVYSEWKLLEAEHLALRAELDVDCIT